MQLIFKKSESTIRPATVDIADNGAYIRKNIHVETRTDTQDNTTTMYVYEEAFCTKDDAINYLSSQNEELKVENAYNNESILDLDFRVTELEG